MTTKFSQRFKTLKAVIAIPNHGSWHAYFGRDMLQMVVACDKHRIENYKDQEIYFYHVRGSILTKSRLECLKEAKKLDADYLLFVDTDQTFPRGTLHRLIARQVDVVGANIATKHIPAGPTARNKGKDAKDWIPVFTDPESTGIEKVDRVGTGILLLSKKVIQSLPYSCFNMFYREDIDDVQGEDWSLCEALEKLGFPIYIDHDLSKLVGHVGDMIYDHNLVGEVVRMPLTQDEDKYVGFAQPRPAEQAG